MSNAAALFDNRIEVSKYYSVEKVGSAIHSVVLLKILEAVSVDAASIVTAKAAIDSLLQSKDIDLSSLNGDNGFRLDVAVNDFSGSAISNTVDVNGDGIDDLKIGAARTDPKGSFSGSSHVIFSRGFTTYTSSGNDILAGKVSAARFVAGNGDDTMIGHSGADVFYGEEGKDTIQVADLNFQRVDGGIGTDGLVLTGSTLNLDLNDIGGRISALK